MTTETHRANAVTISDPDKGTYTYLRMVASPEHQCSVCKTSGQELVKMGAQNKPDILLCQTCLGLALSLLKP